MKDVVDWNIAVVYHSSEVEADLSIADEGWELMSTFGSLGTVDAVRLAFAGLLAC